MTERRWDIVVRIASGPLASREANTYRGPHVVVGTAPPGSGVVLPGGRGIAPQHCTLSAYDPHTVFVTPVGHNPVRVAPYTDVRWEELEPITGRVRLQRGNAIHLGPTGQRGVTLEFVECQDLGMTQVDRIVSDTADTSIFQRPPDGIRAKGKRPDVRQVLTDTLDPATFRLLLASLLGGAGVLLMTALALVVRLWSQPLEQHGEEIWDIGELAFDPVFTVTGGIERPLFDLVVDPNRKAAGTDMNGMLTLDSKKWDSRFFQAVVQATRKWHRSRCVYKRLEEVKDDYKKVVTIVREKNMPEVLAAIPMQESRYGDPNLQVSPCCAKGPWQFMPESGFRLKAMDPALVVEGCHWKDAYDAKTWSPEQPAPPPRCCDPQKPTARYVRPGANGPVCQLGTCDTDFRTDMALSTRAAMITLGEAWNDPVLRRSGALVQIVIASHNAGYDDARFYDRNAPSKPYNMLPAFLEWQAENPTKPTPWFYGDAIRCVDHPDDPACDDYMKPETQQYGFNTVALHMLAMCYYAYNYPNDPVFDDWADYVAEGGYCHQLDPKFGVPAKDEVHAQCRGVRR